MNSSVSNAEEKKRSNTSEPAAKKTRVDTENDCNGQTSPEGITNPLSVLSNTNSKVHSLTVSDQHATLLISHIVPYAEGNDKDLPSNDSTDSTAESKTVKSLLKLTLVPFHKALLGSNPALSPDDSQGPERNFLDHNEKASDDMISFLKGYEFKLKSESGAEYSYYTAKPSSNLYALSPPSKLPENVKDSTTSLVSACAAFGSFDVELVSPANERQISRALPSLGSTLIHETPELYQRVVQPYIQSIIDGGSLNWINNVIEGKKEKERLLVNSDQFIVNIDTKWRTHPPPLTTTREEWYGHKSVEDLYCLGIVKEKGIASLRDLRAEHLPMLKSMQQQGLDAIENVYGVKSDQIRCFVHYQPQFYHFHVHFTRLENEVGSTVERGHLVSDIVQNLEMEPQYYTKRTIAYKLKKGTPLHNLIEDN